MSKDSAAKIHIKGFNDLFGGSDKYSDIDDLNNNENVRKIAEELLKDSIQVKISKLHAFKNHPFIVREDEKLKEMVASIEKVGILNPIIIREDGKDGYEIISGHTRCEAAKRAGLTEIPAIVREYDDDMAIIAMVDSNLQREELSISEKARAYAMKYEALKHMDFEGNRRLDAMSKEMGESNKTIQRIIALNKLSDDLLKLIDEKKLGMRQGLDLIDLNENKQKIVYDVLSNSNQKLTMEQSNKIKELNKEENLTNDALKEVLYLGVESKTKPAVSSKKADNTISLDALYEHFSDCGILSYNREGKCYGLKKDGDFVIKGLSVGEKFTIFVNGRWTDTSIGKDSENGWYLVGTDFAGNLENIIVRIKEVS